MVLIDPKRVELTAYEGIPHLVTPIITNPKKAADALAVGRARDGHALRRPGRLRRAAHRRLQPQGAQRRDQARRRAASGCYTPYPYLLVIVDELADLMMVAPRDVEDSVVRITQLARAAGIHLVLATQRPVGRRGHRPDQGERAVPAGVRDLARWPTRRVILDQPGAEKLIGQGDGLFLPMGASQAGPHPGRLGHRGRDRRRRRRTARTSASRTFRDGRDCAGAASRRRRSTRTSATTWTCCCQAVELVVTTQFGSTSMLQRKLRVGFAKAGRLMDLMETRGIVGPSEGSKARDVLVKPDELDEAAGGLARR